MIYLLIYLYFLLKLSKETFAGLITLLSILKESPKEGSSGSTIHVMSEELGGIGGGERYGRQGLSCLKFQTKIRVQFIMFSTSLRLALWSA